MKRKLLLFAAHLLAVVCFAEGHLTFKGVEIDGKISTFSQKLIGKGLKQVYTSDDGTSCVFEGPFAGFDDCTVFVISSKKEHIVWKIGVWLPDQTSWYALKSRYNDYKQSLADKYGEPTVDAHFF